MVDTEGVLLIALDEEAVEVRSAAIALGKETVEVGKLQKIAENIHSALNTRATSSSCRGRKLPLNGMNR